MSGTTKYSFIGKYKEEETSDEIDKQVFIELLQPSDCIYCISKKTGCHNPRPVSAGRTHPIIYLKAMKICEDGDTSPVDIFEPDFTIYMEVEGTHDRIWYEGKNGNNWIQTSDNDPVYYNGIRCLAFTTSEYRDRTGGGGFGANS